MKPIVFSAALAAAFAIPIAAQNSSGADTGPLRVSVTVPRPVRTAYREALQMGLEQGWTFRMLLLDEALLTTPREPEPGKALTMMRVVFEPKGDSTSIEVAALAMDTVAQRRCTTDECLASELLAATMLVKGITDRLDSLGAVPRSAADSLEAAGALGYASGNAIRVGGGMEQGEHNQHAYLNALRGPGGERVTWYRLGSCCEFQTPNGIEGKAGRLDAYEVTYPGLPHPVVLYINLYDPPQGSAVPQGFTRAQPTVPGT
jgi:hypothetical protein